MAFTNQNQAIVAYKNILGKSNTDVTKEAGNEAEGIFFNIPATTVWMDTISSTPATAVTLGKALAVTATMVVDGTSNGHALFATWPVTVPSGTDPRTGNAFSYGTGSLTGILAGDRIRNAIPPSYGAGYEAKPYASASLISPGDPRDWIYQYNSGVFFQQDGSADIPAYGGSSYTNPTTLQLYVYIGETLYTFTGGGSHGPSEWYDSVFSIEVTPPVSPAYQDRYLIGTGSPAPTGAWAGHEDKIAEWTGTIWEFTTPTTGATVLVDDMPGFMFIYGGTYPSGSWVQTPFGTTRAGVVTGTNTYAVTVTPPISSYEEDLILLLTFANGNTGASTLNVNSIGAVSILKQDGVSGMVALDAGDIIPGVTYMVVYDGFTFEMYLGNTNCIPLTGTKVGHPVTGTVEFNPGYMIEVNGSSTVSNIISDGDTMILLSSDGINYSSVATDYANGVTFAQTYVTGTTSLIVGSLTNSVLIGSTISGFKGARYVANYSANYDNRSLVDKEYVDSGSLTSHKHVHSSSFTGGTTKTITHSLGSVNVICDIVDSTGAKVWGASVNNYTTNTIDVTISVSGTYKVIIIG